MPCLITRSYLPTALRILGRGMSEELSEHDSQRTRETAEDKTRVRPEPSGVANIAL
jgi:hypothetical protein